MAQLSRIFNPLFIGRVVCANTLIGLVLSVGMPSLAEFKAPSQSSSNRISNNNSTIPGGIRAYNPPSDARVPEGDHTSGGVRGCGEGDIAAIAPRLSAIGQTTAQRPTFVWYVFSEDDTDQLEFHLYRYQSDGALEPLFIEQIGPSAQGYTAYELPSDLPDLTVGETYLWQVVSYCDPNLEEIGTWSSADLEVVPSPASLDLAAAETSLDRAQAYANEGLWYEAIAEIHTATTPEEQAFRQSLLLDLAALEAQTETDAIVKLSEQLEQIAQESP